MLPPIFTAWRTALYHLRQLPQLLLPKAVAGQTTLTAIYALLLFETIELAGFNLLRIFFALLSFTVFSQILLTVAARPRLRQAGIVIFVLIIWANLLNFRYFGTTLQLGALDNAGFLPYLGSQIVVLLRLQDILLITLGLSTGYLAADGPILNVASRRKWLGLLLTIYFTLQFVLYFAVTQSPLTMARQYGLDDTRWSIYKSHRLRSEDHTGSILLFGLTWTYLSDALKLRGTSGELEEIPDQFVRFSLADGLPRNIVAIQVESLDRAIINHHIDGIPVTPFLNRLAIEHTFYSQIWAQHSSNGGTSDGDFSFLTSQYPVGYKGSLGTSGLEHLPSVPRILSDNGYTTTAFHANRGALYHRKTGFLNLGFDHVYFKDDFTIADPDRWHTLKDGPFFEQVNAVLDTLARPYFAFLITLSSHSPFNLLAYEDYPLNFDGPSRLSTSYFASMRYVDEALERFINAIIARDPETIFLIYGDHSSNINVPGYATTDNHQLQPIAVLLADFTQPTAATATGPGSSIDLAPTLFARLGYTMPIFWQGKPLGMEVYARSVYLVDAKYWISANGEIQPIGTALHGVNEIRRIRRYLR
ncbi:LTA synthase family protein [Candidatus Neomarinimicrobiota bacterium]